MPTPLAVNEPYPNPQTLMPDALSLRIISPAYASPTGELNAILQYIYHSFFFRKNGHEHISQTLLSIAVAEMRHLELLGSAILSLGAPPVFCRYPATGFDFYSTKYVAYSRSLKFMLEDDLIAERHAVCEYNSMLKKLKNPDVKALISRICADEILHVDALKDILSNFKG